MWYVKRGQWGGGKDGKGRLPALGFAGSLGQVDPRMGRSGKVLFGSIG